MKVKYYYISYELPQYKKNREVREFGHVVTKVPPIKFAVIGDRRLICVMELTKAEYYYAKTHIEIYDVSPLKT